MTHWPQTVVVRPTKSDLSKRLQRRRRRAATRATCSAKLPRHRSQSPSAPRGRAAAPFRLELSRGHVPGRLQVEVLSIHSAHQVLCPVHTIDSQEWCQKHAQGEAIGEEMLHEGEIEANLLAEVVLQGGHQLLVHHTAQETVLEECRAGSPELRAERSEGHIPRVLSWP